MYPNIPALFQESRQKTLDDTLVRALDGDAFPFLLPVHITRWRLSCLSSDFFIPGYNWGHMFELSVWWISSFFRQIVWVCCLFAPVCAWNLRRVHTYVIETVGQHILLNAVNIPSLRRHYFWSYAESFMYIYCRLRTVFRKVAQHTERIIREIEPTLACLTFSIARPLVFVSVDCLGTKT
jgi:hypothetical protein